jgi:nucleotide-binding universal stress UspA family protein
MAMQNFARHVVQVCRSIRRKVELGRKSAKVNFTIKENGVNKVLACVDDSSRATAVCDYSIWAARLLEVQLQFLHVLDRDTERAGLADYSGALGMGAQESLLEQLSSLDEERSRLAQEQGRQILQAAHKRAEAAGAKDIDTLQCHGSLVETLLDLQPEIRLVVIGQQRSRSSASKWYLDQNAERVVRSLQCPVMVVDGDFKDPERFVIAFDGSQTGQKMVQMVAASPLLKGLSCHVIAVGDENDTQQKNLDWATDTLANEGFDVVRVVRPGEAEVVLRQYLLEVDAHILVMGAYGHSRIRHLIMGSTTSTLLRTSPVPVLVLR